MTDSDPRADAEWENLLRQWRNQAATEPRPFFYQRVRARLVAEARPRPLLPTWLRRPAYVAVLALLGVALSGDCAALSAAGPATPRQAQPGSSRSLPPAR